MNRNQWIITVIVAFFVGAIGSFTIGRFVIPRIADVTGWQSLNKFVTSSPIVVNRTHEIQLNEGVNLIDLIKNSGTMVVGIYGQTDNFLGNGIIMSSDGLIFASSAIIGNQTSLSVITNDGQKFVATVKGRETNGLLVLTIPATNLSQAQMDDATNLKPGHRVVYLGKSNVNFEHEAMIGFVTQSIDNQLTTKQVMSDVNFTQNYFGGPIVNLSGRVVGLVINNSENIIAEELQKSLIKYLVR